MGRGGCNCCGEWCTTAKISKNSGAFLWFYNYGVDTYNLNILDNSIYIEPRLGLRYDGSTAYHTLTTFNMRFFNTSKKFDKVGIDSTYLPKVKRISKDGQYKSETNYSTTMFDYNYNYYSSNDGYYSYQQLGDSNNQKSKTTQSNSNRTLIYNGLTAIFQDDSESADKIKASFLGIENHPTSTNHTSDFPLIPKFLIGNSLPPYNYSSLFASYGYAYRGGLKQLESIGNRLIYLGQDKYIDYSTRNVGTNSVRNNNYVRDIKYEDSRVSMTLVFSSDSQFTNLYSNFDFTAYTTEFNGLKKITNVNLSGNTVYRLYYAEDSNNSGYIEFDNNGYTFVPFSFNTNPIFNSIVIDSYTLQEAGIVVTLSIDRETYGSPLAISDIAKKFSLIIEAYYDVTFEEYSSPIVSNNTFITRSVKLIYTMSLINLSYYNLDTITASIDIEQNNQYRDFAYGWDYRTAFQPYIRLFDLENYTFDTINIKDIVNTSTIREDIASREGYQYIDINDLSMSDAKIENMTLAEYNAMQSDPVSFMLQRLGLSEDPLGINIDSGHPYYNNYYYGAFYDYFWNYNYYYFWNGDFVNVLNLGLDGNDIVLNAGIRINKRLVYNHIRFGVATVSNGTVDVIYTTTYRFQEMSPENNIFRFVFDSSLNKVEYIEISDTRLNYAKSNTQFNAFGYNSPFYDGLGGYIPYYSQYSYYDYFGYAGYEYWWANTDRELIASKTKAGITHILRDNDNVRADLARINLNVMSYSSVGAFISDHRPETGNDNTNVDISNKTSNLVHTPFDLSHLNDIVESGPRSGQTMISMTSGIFSQSYGTYDVYTSNNNFIQNNTHNFVTFNSNADVIYSAYIPRAVSLEVDEDGDAYIGTITSSNRVSIYTGTAFVPSNKTINITCYVPEYQSEFDDWVENLNLGNSYESKACFWLMADFNRDTIEHSNTATVTVNIEDKSFQLGLFDTADEVQRKVIDLGYSDIYVYGGPIIDYPICIAGFNPVDFTSMIERVRANDSVARYIAENSAVLSYTYEHYLSRGYNGFIPNVADDRIWALDYRENSIIYNKLYKEWLLNSGYQGFNSDEVFRESRKGFSNFFVSQDGFIEPTFLFVDDKPDKITYDRFITIDEIKSHIDYPEQLDFDMLRDVGNSNPSALFHHGWFAKVENSTTQFKSIQSTLYKVTSEGELAWTKEYGYKPYFETNNTDETVIEKNVYYNGIIQDLQLYDNELYMTGNMINLDTSDPNVFKSYSEYFDRIILTRNTEGQKRKYRQLDNIDIVDSLGVTLKGDVTYYNLRNLNKIKPNVNPST